MTRAPYIMSEVQYAAVRELRAAGYSVVVFTPDEVGEADPIKVAERLVELGNDVISDLHPKKESVADWDCAASVQGGILTVEDGTQLDLSNLVGFVKEVAALPWPGLSHEAPLLDQARAIVAGFPECLK